MDLEVNRKIYEEHLGDGPMDTCVRWSLKKNFEVPAEILYCNFSVYSENLSNPIFSNSYKSKRDALPGGIKVSKFTPKEQALIVKNADSMMREVGYKEDADFKELLYGNVGDNYLTEKRNILGLTFSQGLSNRLHCNVFHQLRILKSRKGKFSEEENDFIMKFMENNTSLTPFLELSTNLNRTTANIKLHYDKCLKHKDKTGDNRKRYTKEEDALIMEALFSLNKNILKENNHSVGADVWNKLGKELNKRPANIHHHWNNFVHPTLVRYEAGVLDNDIREVFFDYLVDNNIMFAQEANWNELAKNPLFPGTTPAYLSVTYNKIKIKAKLKYPNIEDKDFTSAILQRYFRETKRNKIRRKDIENLIDTYQDLHLQ